MYTRGEGPPRRAHQNQETCVRYDLWRDVDDLPIIVACVCVFVVFVLCASFKTQNCHYHHTDAGITFVSPGSYSAYNADDDEPEHVAECFRHGFELDRVSSSSGDIQAMISPKMLRSVSGKVPNSIRRLLAACNQALRS